MTTEPLSDYARFKREVSAEQRDELAFARWQEMNGFSAPAKCWCATCRPITLQDMRMVLCPTCGNKRCPKANDHRNGCTGSNEPGQAGSAYP
jgi:hypothetical protein